MTTEEITSMIKALTASIGAMTGDTPDTAEAESKYSLDDEKRLSKRNLSPVWNAGSPSKS